MGQPPSTSTATEVLGGLVERVTFHNEENGFSVLRVKARGQRDLITVLGHAAMISAGEFVQDAKNERKRFFSESGGVATSLAEKIYLAYVLGVIGPETRKDLTRIRQIRNVFAHAKRHLDFNMKEIVELSDFQICETSAWKATIGTATLTPREVFVVAIQIIAEGLMCPIVLP